MSPVEGVVIEPATEAGGDKDGVQSMSVAPGETQETALHYSCRQQRGSAMDCGKQHHQRSQTMGRC
jgi:hypothetical protein